ncbi:MAG: aspartate 1-decarboxylase, partial [Cyanobacteria bacterium P01_G01_bin.49]
MGTIRLMHAKLHRVRVTEANVNYVGSITVDPLLLNQVGILPLEEVDIINLNNGNRFSTYVIPGETGKGEICPNGGAALLCQPGDLLIIYAYEKCDRTEVLKHGHTARVLVADHD